MKWRLSPRLEHKKYRRVRDIDDPEDGGAGSNDSSVEAVDRDAYLQPCLKPGALEPETWPNETAGEVRNERRLLYRLCVVCRWILSS